MTHEELKEHKGTVWSYAGFMGLHEYEYIGSGRLPIYGKFKRTDNGEVVSGIQVCSCYPTKRAALHDNLMGLASILRNTKAEIAIVQAELDAIGDK